MAFTRSYRAAGRSGRASVLTTLMLVAALAAAAFRAVISTGYMIGHDPADGRLAITICTGDGLSTILIDPATGEPAKDLGAPAPSKHPGDHCPFASFNLLFPLSDAPPVLAVAADYAVFAGWAATPHAEESQDAATPPPSRAPPLVV